jgi:hypothetical protein
MARSIPVAHTPPGGYGKSFPVPVLATCTEPLSPGAPDLRGIWKVLRAQRGGKTAPPGDPIYGYVERIEQCGNRIVDMGGGTVSDGRADGTFKNAIHDVSAFGYVKPIHVIVTYQLWLVLWVRMPLRRFWAAAREPVVYALGANSSLATLPITLRALEKLGVSRSSSTLGACVGTNLNNDGILLYEGMAVLFVAQASGIVLTIPQQLTAAASCMLAAAGVAGVPEAGFISLALVLNTVGLPIELLPLLLTVDWVIARGRSAVNVLSDMMLSILIDGRASDGRASEGRAQ